MPLLPDEEVVPLLVEDVDDVLVDDVEPVDEELDVSAFAGVESPEPAVGFSALTLPDRESLR
ncbi:hypothetical protein [Actinoplanes xinjiangensis]|uniref:hypothetical protein n=1 Tax=Actinoplanes xinjiangensis TaxID=512350 RepID=UPI001A3DB897|nr:hypothetical protein [Actinoplanes xinjiangensis]GIF43204.1 hypothetical protein Axi01nite_75150 [Actinoplanes xinjiangensis]